MNAFFIAGVQRSGTTLLSVMLNNHPDIYMEDKSIAFKMISCFKSMYDILPHNLQHPKEAVLAHIIEQNGKGNLEELINFDKDTKDRDIRSLLRNGIQQRIDNQKVVAWGDKSPMLQYYLKDLLFLLPDAKMIHIVRDGRANAYSAHNRSKKSILLSAQEWVDRNVEGIVHRETIGRDQYLLIRYEDLLLDTETVLRTVCKFLGLNYSEQMLSLQMEDVPEEKRYVKSKIDPSKINQYADYLSDGTVRKIEKIQGPLLKEFGYELKHPEYAEQYRPLSIARRIWLNQKDLFKEIFFPRKVGMKNRTLVKINSSLKTRIYNFLYFLSYNLLSEPIVKNWFPNTFYKGKYLEKKKKQRSKKVADQQIEV